MKMGDIHEAYPDDRPSDVRQPGAFLGESNGALPEVAKRGDIVTTIGQGQYFYDPAKIIEGSHYLASMDYDDYDFFWGQWQSKAREGTCPSFWIKIP